MFEDSTIVIKQEFPYKYVAQCLHDLMYPLVHSRERKIKFTVLLLFAILKTSIDIQNIGRIFPKQNTCHPQHLTKHAYQYPSTNSYKHTVFYHILTFVYTKPPPEFGFHGAITKKHHFWVHYRLVQKGINSLAPLPLLHYKTVLIWLSTSLRHFETYL